MISSERAATPVRAATNLFVLESPDWPLPSTARKSSWSEPHAGRPFAALAFLVVKATVELEEVITATLLDAGAAAVDAWTFEVDGATLRVVVGMGTDL
jgi:hypothetical protein